MFVLLWPSLLLLLLEVSVLIEVGDSQYQVAIYWRSAGTESSSQQRLLISRSSTRMVSSGAQRNGCSRKGRT